MATSACAVRDIVFASFNLFGGLTVQSAMPITHATELPALALRNTAKRKTGVLLSKPSKSTLWRHAHGKTSRKDKAASQQYLNPREEEALVDYVLRMAERGYPLPVKFLRSLALVIARQRSSAFQIPATDGAVRRPGKNWPQGFYQRHPELKSKRVRGLDWARYDHHIHDKVMQWFTVIGRELEDPAIVPENVYSLDETGFLLSVLSSLKVLVSKDDLRTTGDNAEEDMKDDAENDVKDEI